MRAYNGLYQAIVVSSNDPKGKRRITAKIPDVLGQTVSDWARPASIVDAPLPPGEMVWIHFPNGDHRYPVYHVPNDPKHGRIIPSASALQLNGPGSAGVQISAKVHAKKDSGGYVAMVASAFEIASSAVFKTDIMPLNFDPIEAVINAPSKYWRYLPDYGDDVLRLSPMAEDLPEIVQADDGRIDQTSLIGVLWAAVGALAEKVAALEDELHATN